MKKILILVLQVIHISSYCASSFYMAADATITGDGSFGNPWSFQTALNHPAILHPGETIWLRGGIYFLLIRCAEGNQTQRIYIQ